MSAFLDVVQVVATVATAVGVGVAVRQISLTKKLASTTFEDQLASQYRDLIRHLPIAVFLGDDLDDAQYADALPHFYHYFDLSNEQAYLHRRGRVAHETWTEWSEGIEQNMRRPAFIRAWTEVSLRAPESFNDLRAALPDVLPQSDGSPQTGRLPSRGTNKLR